jgi:hypothetical protein
MKTTFVRVTSLTILLGVALTFTATIGFSKTKKVKNESAIATQQQQVVGLVEHVNKDRTFDLISLDGQRYHVRMGKDSLVNAYGNTSFGRQVFKFDDLYSGARISFAATSAETTYVVGDK